MSHKLPESFHRLLAWFLVWATLLTLTYCLTWATVAGVNHTATSWAERKFAREVYWATSELTPQVVIPATEHSLVKVGDRVPSNPRLEPGEIGCKNEDEIPAGLKKVSPWSLDKSEAKPMAGRLFPDEPEDPFDWFYKKYLGFRVQPIEREKNFRRKYHFEVLLAKVDDDTAREQMLRHFSNVYGELMKFFPCRMIRWINGWVQITAIGVFWLTIQLVIVQFVSGVVAERLQARKFFPFRDQLADGSRIDREKRPEETNEWLIPARIERELDRLYNPSIPPEPRSAVLILREVYETYLRGPITAENYRDTPGAAIALEQAADREHRKIESSMAALVYLGWSLPSLGFIGTVLGLGTALLTAGDMVTPNSELQRDAIQSVSIYLGRAFDKTFVALVLSVIQMALVYGVRRAQETVVFEFQDRIARAVIPRMKC